MLRYVCFKCRKGYKKLERRKAQTEPLTPQQPWTPPHFTCPNCGHDLTLAGVDQSFRTPPRSNFDQWRKVELLVRNGFIFSKHSLPYPEKPPVTLGEARKFVKGLRKPTNPLKRTRATARRSS